MIEDIYEPLREYRDEFRERFSRLVSETFENLTKRSGIDAEANARQVARLRSLTAAIGRARSVLRMKECLIALAWLGVGAGMFFAWRSGSVLAAAGWEPVADASDVFVLSVSATAGLLVLIFALLMPWRRRSIRRISELEVAHKACMDEAWRQMAPLNQLYDWDMATRMIQAVVPRIGFDPYFNEARLHDLRAQFGWNDEFNSTRSVIFSQSGQIKGNPFVFGECLRAEWGQKTYTGNLDIEWRERVTGADGRSHWERRTETLQASVTKPYPCFRDEKFLVFGNDAAPNLVFSRQPSDLSGLDDGFFYNRRKRQEMERLEEFSRNLDDEYGYTMMANKEFETLFHATDRNDEVEFRLLFTALAQTQMLALLKDKSVGYGDDFAMYKDRRINVIRSNHLCNAPLDTDPSRFWTYDYQDARRRFQSFHEQYFKDIYFTLAPLLSIPLYQQTRTHEDIYGDAARRTASFWEHEAIANYFGDETFKHPSCVTRNILKTSIVGRAGGTSTVAVTAYGYRGEARTEYVTVRGGDGERHSVPVEWIEYIPVSRTSRMTVSEYDGRRPSAIPEGQRWRRSILSGLKG